MLAATISHLIALFPFCAAMQVPLFAAVMHMNLQLNAIASSNHLLNVAVGLERREVNMTVPKKGVLGLAHVQVCTRAVQWKGKDP